MMFGNQFMICIEIVELFRYARSERETPGERGRLR